LIAGISGFGAVYMIYAVDWNADRRRNAFGLIQYDGIKDKFFLDVKDFFLKAMFFVCSAVFLVSCLGIFLGFIL